MKWGLPPQPSHPRGIHGATFGVALHAKGPVPRYTAAHLVLLRGPRYRHCPLFCHAGGTLLRVFTEGVANRSDLGCMFPDQSTPATFVSPTELRCLAPPTNSSSTQCRGEALEVTLLTGQATKNAVPLLRVPSPAILGVQPSRGYYRAPQWVRLTGYGYVDSQQLSCLFYNEAGLQVSPNPTPPHPNAPQGCIRMAVHRRSTFPSSTPSKPFVASLPPSLPPSLPLPHPVRAACRLW